MDIILTTLLGLLKMLHFILHPVYVYRAKGKCRKLPPIKSDLIKLSATDLAAKIRKKEISSEEACTIYIERIKEVNPFINAVVEERFQHALQDAKNVDDYLMKCQLNENDLETNKPLLGVPLSVKESCGVKGLSLCVGTLSRTGYKAEVDGEQVSRLKASGAIPLLVSNNPELCLSWESNNLVTGATNNPYDTTCTSAGSSGGEGALLGAGASVIGLGSDIAGSIRLPALNNGIFGHKPSPKIASIKGHYPYCNDRHFEDFLVIGPMTRYATDLKLMLKVMVGDKLTLGLRLNDKVNFKDINVFFMEDHGFSLYLPTVQPEIKTIVNKSVQYLAQNCGATIKNHKFPEFKYASQVCGKMLYSMRDIPNPLKWEKSSLDAELLKTISGHSKYSKNLLFFLLQQKIYSLCVGDHSKEVASWRTQFIEQLGENGVFLYPTAPTSAGKHNEFFLTIPGVMYQIVANALGLPATHIPCGLNEDGMPIGIQVMAAPNQDRLCLAVAEELEKCFGGWVPPK